MFFLGYLRSELVRRKSRTILTVLGLAVGVSLVIVVSALSRGLDKAQAKASNPLSSIGTDLTVTLAPRHRTPPREEASAEVDSVGAAVR